MSSPDSSRWLVTINGRSTTTADMQIHSQRGLQTYLATYGIETPGGHCRSEFAEPIAANDFRGLAAEAFPEDDVRLWTSVDPSTKER